MAEAAAQNSFYQGLVHLFPFPLPECRDSVDFSACFKTYIKSSEETKTFINSLVLARQRLVRSMYGNVRFEERLGAVDEYLPLIISLQQSWQESSQTMRLKLDRDHIFEWRLYLHGRPELFRSNEIVFDIIMCYHWKVLQISRLCHILSLCLFSYHY